MIRAEPAQLPRLPHAVGASQLTIDIAPGRGSGFSVEAPHGVRFLTRSRVFTDDEARELDLAGPPHRGPLEA